ncbi:MAG: gephyrin-like molybdotransferase Glp [Acidobacteriota bacterium]
MELGEAKRLALGLVSPLEAESVRLEAALGRVLAEDVASGFDLPGEARSRLDGYALKSADTTGTRSGNPVSLAVLDGTIAAGHSPEQRVGPGECVRILTGAPMPEGADAVVPQEDVEKASGRLLIKRPVSGGIVSAGEDARKGGTLLHEGDLLTPSRLAVLAAVGRTDVCVHRKPRVALLATGDEVREVGESLHGPLTHCNNRLLLGWLATIHGAEAIHLGIAVDDPKAVRERLSGVEADIIVTTGGIGRGDRDCVLEAWRGMGVELHFREINLTPGKNSALGSKEGRVHLALPGNPWGAQVVFEELAAPLIRRMQGLKAVDGPSVAAVLERPLKKREGFYKAERGALDGSRLPPVFVPSRRHGPVLADIRDGFAYILLEPHVVEVAAGSAVRVRFHDFPLLATASMGSGDDPGGVSEG